MAENQTNVSNTNTNDNQNVATNTNVESGNNNTTLKTENTNTSTKVDDSNDNDVNFSDNDNVDDNDDDSLSKNLKNPSKQIVNVRERNRIEAQNKRNAKNQPNNVDSYYRGIKDSVGDVNPFTNQKMVTNEDYDLYITMKEMDKAGLDPTNTMDYLKYYNEKKQAVEKEEQLKAEADKKYQQDLIEFNEKYKDVNIVELMKNNSNWQNSIVSLIKSGMSLVNAYETISNIVNENANNLAEDKLKIKMKNAKASVLSQIETDNQVQKVNFLTMSDEEFKKYQEKRRNQR